MDNSRSKRGYALSGLVCVGTLACGSDRPSGQEGSETTGYPMTTTESSSTDGSETATGSETGTETSTGESDDGELD
jgi:hypothetical protein